MAYDLISGKQTSRSFARGEHGGSSMMGADGSSTKVGTLAVKWGGLAMLGLGLGLHLSPKTKHLAMPLVLGGGVSAASIFGMTKLAVSKPGAAKVLAATAAAGLALGVGGAFIVKKH